MSSKLTRALTVLGVCALATFAGNPPAASAPQTLPAINLNGMDGKKVSSAEWAGKVVVIDFWATWCMACREAFPELTDLKAKYGDKAVIVGVSTDKGAPDKVQKFAGKNKLNYLILHDPDDTQSKVFGFESVPSLYVYGTDGKLLVALKGLEADNKKKLEEVLAANVK